VYDKPPTSRSRIDRSEEAGIPAREELMYLLDDEALEALRRAQKRLGDDFILSTNARRELAQSLETIVTAVGRYRLVNPPAALLIQHAGQMARRAHEGQTRKYGRGPYIQHPFRVGLATFLATDGNAEATAAALLHDTVEDTALTLAEIEARLGAGVAGLVRELTNIRKPGPRVPRADRKRQDRERLAAASDTARLIKALDRTDNLRDLVIAAAVDEGARAFLPLYLAESRALALALGERGTELLDMIEPLC
jgi:hypothetical protein